MRILIHRPYRPNGSNSTNRIMISPKIVALSPVCSASAAGMKSLAIVIISGSTMMNTAPNSLYPTRDGAWVLIAANNDAIFGRLARAMGHPEWVDDPRWSTQIERGRRVDEMDAMVGAWTAGHDAAEVVGAMLAAEVPVAKVHTIADIFADPHFAARGMLARVPHPTLGQVTLPGVVPRLSDTPGAIAEPGHEHGADTDAVLRDWLGYGDEAIAGLRSAGALA